MPPFRFDASILENSPISFRVSVFPTKMTADDRPHSAAGEQTNPFGFLNCLSDSTSNCLESDASIEAFPFGNTSDSVTQSQFSGASSSLSRRHYSKLEDVVRLSEIAQLRTQRPTWNSELQRWMLHFGGRVKVPSNNNFILLLDVDEEERKESGQEYALDHLAGRWLGSSGSGGGGGGSRVHLATDYGERRRVIMRHGKVCDPYLSFA